MAINRETFLHDALKVWYEHSNRVAAGVLLDNRGAANAFKARNESWLEAHKDAKKEDFIALEKEKPGAVAYFLAKEAQEKMASFALTIAALDKEEELTPIMYEAILEDFRHRTAVKVKEAADSPTGFPEWETLAENIYGNKEISGDRTTFSGKISFGEALLAGATKRSKVGVLAPKNPKELIDYTLTKEAFTELTRAIAIFDYNRELREVEIPREIERANQMNAVKGVFNAFRSATTPDELRAAAETCFKPFADAGRFLTEERLKDIKEKVTDAQAALTASTFYSDEKGVDYDHLTGSVQTEFEAIYNSLFGMSNLRDRNPKVAPVYPPLSSMVVNEIARRLKTSSLAEDNWLLRVKSNPLYPADFVDRAVSHAEGLLEAQREFAKVSFYTKEVGADGKPRIVETQPTMGEVRARLAAQPNTETYSSILENSIIKYFSSVAPEEKRSEFTKLSVHQQSVVAQLIAREMTTKGQDGSVSEAIHLDLVTRKIPDTVSELIETGNFPQFSDLNKFAMSLVLKPGEGTLVPDGEALVGIYSQLYSDQATIVKEKMDQVVAIYIEGQPEELKADLRAKYADPAHAAEVAADAGFNASDYSFDLPVSYEQDGEIKVLETRDPTGRVIVSADDPKFVNAFGSKFYYSDGYGSYGYVEKKLAAQDMIRAEEEARRVRTSPVVSGYDGYKFKLLTKSDYYKQKCNEYYQIFMRGGGPQQYLAALTTENAIRSIKMPTITPEAAPVDEEDDEEEEVVDEEDDEEEEVVDEEDDEEEVVDEEEDEEEDVVDEEEDDEEDEEEEEVPTTRKISLPKKALTEQLKSLYTFDAEMVAIFRGSRVSRSRLAANAKGVGIARTQTETQRNMGLTVAEFILKQAERCNTPEDLERLNGILAKAVEAERTTKAGVNPVEVDRKTSCSVSVNERGVKSVCINGVTYQHQTVCGVGEEPRDVLVRGYDLDHADQLAEAELISAVTNPNLSDTVRNSIIQANIERLRAYKGGVLLAPEDKQSFITFIPHEGGARIMPATTEQINAMPNAGNIADPAALTEGQERSIVDGFKGPERLGTTSEVVNHSEGSVTDSEITLT